MQTRYNNPAMRQLTEQQARYAPRKVKLEQIENADRLLDKIDPDKEYQYRDVCKWITSYQSEMYPNLTISGKDAVHDLRCFVEDMSDSANLSVDTAGEPVLTVQDVSERYNVSTKTVDRWRDRGLASRRFRFGARKRIGFLQSTVERFVHRHADEVSRGARFTQLTENEREEIIRRARRLVRQGGCPSDVSRRIARKLKRSPETIRYTLRTYDREHPETPVFPYAPETLSDEQRQNIFRAFRRGASVELLAQKYCRTRSSMYRIISEVRAKRLQELPLDCIYNAEFDTPDAQSVILSAPPVTGKKSSKVKPPPGLPPYLASLYAIPLLTRDEEAYYFRKMNFLKYQAMKLRERIDPIHPKAEDMDRLEGLLDRSAEVKNFLIRSNLRLVVSIAKRHIRANTNFFEMVSDGNMSLIRAIEKFDYSKGNKFSTYASWAIMKNFARSIPAEHTQHDRFRTGNEEVFQKSSDPRGSQFQEEMVNRRQRQLIGEILGQLDDREKDIIVYRYGLQQEEPQTLEQVGQHFGVTKERIRQIEARALKKLRRIAEEERIDVPGV